MLRERMARWRSAEGRAWWIGTAAATVVLAVLLALTGPGQALAKAVFRFLEFYTGVFALVALSLTVMGGFLATDRVVLLVRHRVMLQSAHRLTGLLGVSFLAIHVLLKVAEGHAGIVDVVVPFLSDNRRLFVGCGTIAAYLMVGLVWTGFTRGRFASGNRPWVWRALHVSAYPAWLIALIHGLKSGRHAATWVTVSYIMCMVLVGLGVLVRLGVSRSRRAGDISPAAGPRHGASAPPAKPGFVPATPPPLQQAAPPPLQQAAPPPLQQAAPPLAIAPPTPRRTGKRRMTRGAARRPLSDDEFWRHMKGDSIT